MGQAPLASPNVPPLFVTGVFGVNFPHQTPILLCPVFGKSGVIFVMFHAVGVMEDRKSVV